MIPYGRQHITEDDIAAVTAVLRSDWLTQGPTIERFEAALCAQTGAGHAVAMNSATSALHVACAALGLGPGDRLWTSPNTFLASAYAGLYCGADVDFVDIDPATGNMSVAALAEKLEQAERTGLLPKIVVPVHFAGRPCAMAAIHVLGQRYGFRIIEDAAHAIGARDDGAFVGSGRHADVTVFSFHPVKVITSAEGGAAMTNDPALAARMRRLRSHGTTRDHAEMTGPPDGPWTYQALELGWNYRMTDVQAALGASQLGRLEAYVARRAELAARYTRRLAGTGLTLPPGDAAPASAWHLYVIGWNADDAQMSRRAAFEHLRAAGIGVQVHYAPVHLQPLFRARGFHEGQFPEAEDFYARAITLPLHATLSEAEQDRVIEVLPLSRTQRAGVSA